MDEKEKKLGKTVKNKSPKIILGALFVLVFLLGWILGHQDARFSRVGFIPDIFNKTGQYENVDFSLFWRAWDILKEKYDGSIDWNKAVTGAIRGLTESLGDPYTTFLSQEEAKDLESELSGVIYGIGAEIGIRSGKITVIAPIDDSPAKKAGVLAGDIILQINDEQTEGMSVDAAISKIRGQEGTKVKLIIERSGAKKELEITRAKIVIENIKSEIKNGNVGYVSIARFDENTTTELRKVLSDFNAKGIKKVILDLRDNPGGYLNESVTVASEFVGSGAIVTEKKDSVFGRKNEYKAVSGGKMTSSDVKLIVLINKGSASASEIVAGAIKDHKRGTLVGEKTFGKGSVQEIENLGKGAKLKITVAHWYTPDGKNISKEGISPDVEVKMSDEDYNKGRDPQLDKAIELLK